MRVKYYRGTKFSSRSLRTAVEIYTFLLEVYHSEGLLHLNNDVGVAADRPGVRHDPFEQSCSSS